MIARSTFSVTGWDENEYDNPESPAKLSLADVLKTFTGDFEGTSTAKVLMCLSDPEDYTKGAGYIASEVYSGNLAGRDGSFIVQHGGLSGPDGESTYGTVVPGSGTGGLAGLSGTVIIERDDDGTHHFILDYSLAT